MKKPLQIIDLQRLFAYVAEWTGLCPGTPKSLILLTV